MRHGIGRIDLKVRLPVWVSSNKQERKAKTKKRKRFRSCRKRAKRTFNPERTDQVDELHFAPFVQNPPSSLNSCTLCVKYIYVCMADGFIYDGTAEWLWSCTGGLATVCLLNVRASLLYSAGGEL